MNGHTSRSRFSGVTADEWISGAIAELSIDAVGLHAVVGTFRKSFGMDGKSLDDAVRKALTALMTAGARPLQGHNDDGDCYWTRVTHFGDDPAAIVEGVIAEWHASGVDPDFGDVWFASPQYIIDEARY